MPADLSKLRARLSDVAHRDAPSGTVPAAVLVPLVETGDGLSLVFTRRSDELSRHSGEISFPGGRVEPGESPEQAALRETEEELGVPPDTVDMLGPLPTSFTVVSGYEISPWVGMLEAAEFTPNPREIAEVLLVSVETLLRPEARREQRFIRAGGMFANPAYDVGTNTIWGATARILTELLELIEVPSA